MRADLFSTVLNRTGFITFFGSDRNEIVWFGYKFQNDSEKFGLAENEFPSENFPRVGHKLFKVNPIHSASIRAIPKFVDENSLPKVSDQNSYRTNPKFHESF